MSAHPIPAWNGRDLRELLALEALTPTIFRTRCGDANSNGRAYGGQVLAQALMAAAQTVPAGRTATAMQLMFLQGTLHDEALDLHVTPLQDGKRFTTRHVRGMQAGGRLVLDAQVTFAVPIEAPAHAAPARVPLEDPETLPTIADLPAAWAASIARAIGYTLSMKDVLDFRLASPPELLRLDLPEPRFRFWIRLNERLSDAGPGEHVHAAAFAYLSDWWLNYAAVGGHQLDAIDYGGLYVASLNHTIWLHHPVRADEWLHFESISPAAASGRGLSIARVHDRSGHLVASCAQECVMAPRA